MSKQSKGVLLSLLAAKRAQSNPYLEELRNEIEINYARQGEILNRLSEEIQGRNQTEKERVRLKPDFLRWLDHESLRGRTGPQGERGLKGDRGLPGKDGQNGRRGERGLTGKQGPKGERGLPGAPGANGAQGLQGEKGEKGDVPAHEWDGTRLRFENPDGSWGEFVDLQGEKGRQGLPGGSRRASAPDFVAGSGLTIVGITITVDNRVAIALSDGSTVFSEGDINVPFDDYSAIEYLDDVNGDGSVKTFTFSSPVQFIVVEMISTSLVDATIESAEGRVIAGGQTPTATKGAVLKHEQPVTQLVSTDTVKVLAPAETRIVVYGKRR